MAWNQTIIRLQEIDRELQEREVRLKEIRSALQDQDELKEARREFEQAEDAVKKASKAQKDLEFTMEQTEAELRRTEERLYSGNITSPRELEDLQAKSQALRRRRSTLENELLEAMMYREEAGELLETAQERLEEATANQNVQQEHLRAEQREFHGQIERLTEEADKIREEIPPTILDSYNYLKPRTGRMPVAQLRGDVCSVCGVVVNKPTRQKVRRELEAYCDSCRRILVSQI